MTTVAIIGLGNMGSGMADNLVKGNFDVTAFDLSEAALDKAKEFGCKVASSAVDAVKGAEIVVTMLPASKHVHDIYANQILANVDKNTLLIDCSTIDVGTAKAVSELAESHGLKMLDAPVSGGTAAAAAGTLTFMVGGSDAGFATLQPLFEIMGNKAVHCGDAGAGQAVKICNNMILGVTMIATCESIALGDKLGVDRQKLFDVLSTSSGASWTVNSYFPAPDIGPKSPADNNYIPGFAAEMMVKDLGLAQAAAEDADADTPMGAAALALYKIFVEDEDGLGRDFSAMLPRFSGRGRH